ncbi:hypothetical protein ZWY2020_058911 [Hordeum vulgare]|nr:hypothetical protein ZWY2020_058911 [Hordeum vulgare]
MPNNVGPGPSSVRVIGASESPLGSRRGETIGAEVGDRGDDAGSNNNPTLETSLPLDERSGEPTTTGGTSQRPTIAMEGGQEEAAARTAHSPHPIQSGRRVMDREGSDCP